MHPRSSLIPSASPCGTISLAFSSGFVRPSSLLTSRVARLSPPFAVAGLAPFEAYLDSIIDTLPIFIYTLTLTGSASKVDGVLGPKELLTFYILDLEHPQFSFTCFDPVVDDKSGLRICQSIKFLNWAVSKNNHGVLNDIITLLEPMAARKTEGPATVVKPVITLEIVMSFIFALVLWARPPLQAAPTEKLSVIGNLLNNPVILAHFFAPLFTTGTEIDFDLALEITTILTDCGWPHANGLQAQIFAPKRQADETDMEVAKVKQKAAETDKEVAKVKQHMNGLEQKWDKKFGLFVSLIFTIISTGFANMALKMKDMTDVMGDASRAQSRADTESRDPSSTVL